LSQLHFGVGVSIAASGGRAGQVATRFEPDTCGHLVFHRCWLASESFFESLLATERLGRRRPFELFLASVAYLCLSACHSFCNLAHDRLTHAQRLLAWNLSPLGLSRISFLSRREGPRDAMRWKTERMRDVGLLLSSARGLSSFVRNASFEYSLLQSRSVPKAASLPIFRKLSCNH